MSEPTYRVELDHNPADSFPWKATLVRIADNYAMRTVVGQSREDAFDRAQAVVRAMRNPEPSSTVDLTEDGDILDPHEVQR